MSMFKDAPGYWTGIHLFASEELFREMFLGKPGDSYTLTMTPDFQELLEEKLGSSQPHLIEATFKKAPGDTIIATFLVSPWGDWEEEE